MEATANSDRFVLMAVATSDLFYEGLKGVQRHVSAVHSDIFDLKQQMTAVRGHLVAIQQDVGNIYNRPGHLEDRVDRIEVRLGLVEPTH